MKLGSLAWIILRDTAGPPPQLPCVLPQAKLILYLPWELSVVGGVSALLKFFMMSHDMLTLQFSTQQSEKCIN